MCASCGHMSDGMCDIHNSVPIHGASEEHGCHYWQMETDKTDTRCESCAGFEFTTPSKTWGRCNLGFTKKEIHGNWFTCKQFQKSQQDEAEIIRLCIDCASCKPADTGEEHPSTHMCYNASHRVGADWYFDKSAIACENFEKKGENEVNCKIEDCGFNDGESNCGFDKGDIQGGYFEEYANKAVKFGCKNKTLKAALENIQKEQKESKHKNCSNEALGKSCPCNGMGKCGAKEFSDGEFEARYSDKDFECEVARARMRQIQSFKEIEAAREDVRLDIEDVHEDAQEEQTEMIETAIDAPVSNSVQEFDYSSVDNDTASFLQDKAVKIAGIKVKAMIDTAIELEEAHSKLSNHYNGKFGAWCESIGISDRTARNYLSALDWVRKKFPNIEDAKTIPTTLLFAASKTSAPEELQDGVASGDISTHKQYKDLEAKLKAEQAATRVASQAIEDAERETQKLKAENRNIYEAYQKDIKSLNEQLEKAKENSDPDKVKELENSIKVFQQQLDDMSEMLDEKDRQLKEQPIEVTASKVEEVIPQELKQAVVDNVVDNINKLLHISEHEYNIFIEAGRADTDKYLDIIDDFLLHITSIRKEIAQK